MPQRWQNAPDGLLVTCIGAGIQLVWGDIPQPVFCIRCQRHGMVHRLRVMPYFPLEQDRLFVQPFFALAGREIFRWVYRFLCGFQPVPFVIVAARYYDEITVLSSFSDACHFDHSFVCIDTKDTNLCDTKLSPNPTKNGHDTCANRAKHQKFANITNSGDPPKRENPHCGCAAQTKTPGALS